MCRPVLDDSALGTCSIDVFDFKWNGRRIYLIDTPGFNDTKRSDFDTLRILATYLGASYANGVSIHGIIMLHPISDNRMSGSSLRNVEMIKAMCDFGSYHNLAIATTMWPEAPGLAETETLKNREAELLADNRFFGALVAKGATVSRHNARGCRNESQETVSAQNIVARLIQYSDIHAPEVLRLQREIVDQGKTLRETAAGFIVATNLIKISQAHKEQLSMLETELKGELARADAAHAKELRELKTDFKKQLKKTHEETRALGKAMHDLHNTEEKAWKERIEVIEERFCKEIAAKEEELLDMEHSVLEIRKDIARRSSQQSIRKQKENKDNAMEHEQIVRTVQQDVVKAKASYNRFRSQKGNIINGLTNGLAAGTTSGVIAAGKPTILTITTGKCTTLTRVYSLAAAGGLLCVVM